MNSRNTAWFLICLFFSLAVPTFGIAGERLQVSLQHLQWDEGDRIVEFQIGVQGARIVTVREIPPDWTITINNADVPTLTVSGSARHGAGAFTEKAGSAYFHNFMIIEVDLPSDFSLPLELSGEVFFTSDTSAKSWSIPLIMDSFRLKPADGQRTPE